MSVRMRESLILLSLQISSFLFRFAAFRDGLLRNYIFRRDLRLRLERAPLALVALLDRSFLRRMKEGARDRRPWPKRGRMREGDD